MVTPAYDARIVTGDGSATLDVSMEKLACVAPSATVTADGTFATAVLLLDNETLVPPAGAPAASETVPSGRACPGTDAGATESPVSVADAGAGAAVGVDGADATTAVGAAGDESSPHAIDDAADATATRVKNLPSHGPVYVLKTCRIDASSGGVGRSMAILLPTG
jgi:hypothetical protein